MSSTGTRVTIHQARYLARFFMRHLAVLSWEKM